MVPNSDGSGQLGGLSVVIDRTFCQREGAEVSDKGGSSAEPKIGRFSADFWLNLVKLYDFLIPKSFHIFLAGNRPKNRPILGPFLTEYVA